MRVSACRVPIRTLQAGGPRSAPVTKATMAAEWSSVSHLQQAEKSRSTDILLQLSVWGPMRHTEMAGVCQVRTGPCAESATRRTATLHREMVAENATRQIRAQVVRVHVLWLACVCTCLIVVS